MLIFFKILKFGINFRNQEIIENEWKFLDQETSQIPKVFKNLFVLVSCWSYILNKSNMYMLNLFINKKKPWYRSKLDLDLNSTKDQIKPQ